MKSKKNKGLGKGLSALFGDQKSRQKDPKISQKSLRAGISDLRPNKYQPRVHFNEEKLLELANSELQNGRLNRIFGEVKVKGVKTLDLDQLVKLEGFCKLFDGSCYVTKV